MKKNWGVFVRERERKIYGTRVNCVSYWGHTQTGLRSCFDCVKIQAELSEADQFWGIDKIRSPLEKHLTNFGQKDVHHWSQPSIVRY